eukprot:365661-Chlamydomonas_euryale.AAC.80
MAVDAESAACCQASVGEGRGCKRRGQAGWEGRAVVEEGDCAQTHASMQTASIRSVVGRYVGRRGGGKTCCAGPAWHACRPCTGRLLAPSHGVPHGACGSTRLLTAAARNSTAPHPHPGTARRVPPWSRAAWSQTAPCCRLGHIARGGCTRHAH